MAAVKLNQILAIEKGVKGDTDKALTGKYHLLQKAAPFAGLTRTYRKLNDDDPDLPGETTLVQVKIAGVLAEVGAALTRLFDVTAAKDWTNCSARADVVVDDRVLIKAAPATYLLFLEKKLVDIETLIRKLPTLDPAESWELDDNTGVYRTPGVDSARTKKVLRNHVKAAATDKHPAQVEVYTEDVVTGYWKTTKFSGNLPATRIRELTDRVVRLAEAVKMAREQANVTHVEDPKPGAAVFDYLFA